MEFVIYKICNLTYIMEHQHSAMSPEITFRITINRMRNSEKE